MFRRQLVDTNCRLNNIVANLLPHERNEVLALAKTLLGVVHAYLDGGPCLNFKRAELLPIGMVSFRSLTVTLVYLSEFVLLIYGSATLPSRPTITTTGGQPDQQLVAEANALYQSMVLESNSFKILVSGGALLVVTFLVHVCACKKRLPPTRIAPAESPKSALKVTRVKSRPKLEEVPLEPVPMKEPYHPQIYELTPPDQPMSWVQATYEKNRMNKGGYL